MCVFICRSGNFLLCWFDRAKGSCVSRAGTRYEFRRADSADKRNGEGDFSACVRCGKKSGCL